MHDSSFWGDRALGFVDRAVRLLAVIGCVTLALLVTLTGVGVFFRYVLNSPINGLDDILSLLLTVTVAASLAYGGRVGAHVAVDVLGMAGGRRITRWSDILVRILGIIILAFAVYALIRNGICGITCGYLSSSLAIPYAPFYYFLALGLGAYGVVLIIELVVGIANFWRDKDPSEKIG